MPLSNRPISLTKHVQDTAATSWTIVHNSGGYPIVDVYISYNGGVQKILPMAVKYVDENTVEIDFTEPRAGFATVIV